MKLSEEMILGSTLMRHINRIGDLDVEKAGCALQLASAVRRERLSNVIPVHNTCMAHPWVLRPDFSCPAGCNVWPSCAAAVIVHLNDQHKWSIDQIAQWVASVEPPEATPPITEGQVELKEQVA